MPNDSASALIETVQGVGIRAQLGHGAEDGHPPIRVDGAQGAQRRLGGGGVGVVGVVDEDDARALGRSRFIRQGGLPPVTGTAATSSIGTPAQSAAVDGGQRVPDLVRAVQGQPYIGLRPRARTGGTPLAPDRSGARRRATTSHPLPVPNRRTGADGARTHAGAERIVSVEHGQTGSAGNASTSSALADATCSSEPKNSVCASPIRVMIPMVGRAIRHSSAM